MSFRLRVESIETEGGEIIVRGRLTEGAYFGPQYVRVQDASGRKRTAVIVSHGMMNVQAWPVTAEHDTTLELYIATPEPGFAIRQDSIVEGLGNVPLRQDSTDLTGELSNPLFWANFSELHMVSEAVESPHEEFFGLAGDAVGSYYKDFLMPLIGSAAWPIFLLDLDGDRYAEAEWAGGAEYQNRIWIGSRASGSRALLGYDSGHFSLPGLRPSELVWLLDRLEQAKVHPASGLILAPMCYLPEPDARLTRRLASLCARVPGARVERAGTMAATMVERQVVPEARWERRPGFGWCCTWEYSQRNPQGPMSVLSQANFQFIERFFCEVGDA